MALGAPSIQSFFQKEVPTVRPPKPAKPVEATAGDGFTSSEIESALHAELHPWQPRCEYKDIDIGNLEPGPGCVAIQGRVVNLYEQPFASKMPHAAKGCLNLLVKDNTGVMRVRIYYAWRSYIADNRAVGQTSLCQSQLRLTTGPPRFPMDPAHLEC